MKVPASVISEIRREIEQKKKEISELENALNVLEKIGSLDSDIQEKKPAPIPLNDSDSISIDDLGIDDKQSKDTLKSQVWNVVSKLGTQEFTVAHVDAALKRFGIEVNGKHPRSRISIVLSKLEDEGLIHRTFTGAGNVPNRFVLKQDAFDLA